MSADFSSTHFQRGLHLLRVRRLAEAEAAFKDALASDPDNDMILHNLALAIWRQDGREKQALDVIRQAVRIAPNDSDHQALTAQMTANVIGTDQAMRFANEAIRLEPTSTYAWTVRAQLHLADRKLRDAESDARKALEFEPENDAAANILSHALRMQGRTIENAAQIAGMLARNPEDDDNHTAAGWNALQSGRYADAQTHFREALRLNPENAFAREGLIESFRARSRLYRIHLRWTLWMQGRSQQMQLLVIVGLFVVMKFSRVLFSGKYAPLAIVIVGLYMMFVLWMHLARGLGNLMLLCDRFARLALHRREKWDAAVTGGSVLSALVIGAIGAVFGSILCILSAATLLLAAIPFAHTFVNNAPFGRIFFGAAALFILGAGATLVCDVLFNLGLTRETISTLVRASILTGLVTTWLANIPFLRR